MPLTKEPIVFEGGCNCNAIRYRVSVPADKDRPFYPGGGAEADPQVRVPLITSDHCNDCRAATGSVLPHWLGTPMKWVNISLVDTRNVPKDGRLGKDTPRRAWQPAEEVFKADDADPTTSLVFFASSEGRRRSFCGRCGTPLTYSIFPPLDWLQPEPLDIVHGTIDRQYLEEMSPDAQFWWSLGIDWVKHASTHGYSVPRYPQFKVNESVDK